MTHGLQYLPYAFQRPAVYSEAVIVCDMEGLDNDMLKYLTEPQRQSYKKCLIQLYALTELFSSVIVYNSLDIRVAEDQLQDMLLVDYETKKYRKAKRYFCIRDATQKKIKEFKDGISAIYTVNIQQ